MADFDDVKTDATPTDGSFSTTSVDAADATKDEAVPGDNVVADEAKTDDSAMAQSDAAKDTAVGETGATLSEDTTAKADDAAPAGVVTTETDDGKTVVADAGTGEAVKGTDGEVIAVDKDAGVAVTDHPDSEVPVVADPATGEAIKDSEGEVIPVDKVETVSTDAGEAVADPKTSEPVVAASGEPIVVGTTSVETLTGDDAAKSDAGATAESAASSDTAATTSDSDSASTAATPADAEALPSQPTTSEAQATDAQADADKGDDGKAKTDDAGNPIPDAGVTTSAVEPDPIAVQPNQNADGTATSDKPVYADGAGGDQKTDEPAKLNGVNDANQDVCKVIPKDAIEKMREAGNLFYAGLAQYGAEEIEEIKHNQTFIAVHNKIAGVLAALEALFSKE